MNLPFDTPVSLHTAMDAFELVFEAVLEGHRLFGELHPRGVGGECVDGAVAGSFRAGHARDNEQTY